MTTGETRRESEARDRLASLLVQHAQLDPTHTQAVRDALTVKIAGHQIEIQFRYLGETDWYDWDGTLEGLGGAAEMAAQSFAATLACERARFGPTPWDRIDPLANTDSDFEG
jgi:hypothetical protein